MTRIDLVRDKVDTLTKNVERNIADSEQTNTRLTNLETASLAMTDTLCIISADLQEIKDGPVYALDKYISRKVATYTMGMGSFGALMWLITIALFP